MKLPAISGLITNETKLGNMQYALHVGEWAVVTSNQVLLYRDPEGKGYGNLVMSVNHNGTEENIESMIRLALNYYGE